MLWTDQKLLINLCLGPEIPTKCYPINKLRQLYTETDTAKYTVVHTHHIFPQLATTATIFSTIAVELANKSPMTKL